MAPRKMLRWEIRISFTAVLKFCDGFRRRLGFYGGLILDNSSLLTREPNLVTGTPRAKRIKRRYQSSIMQASQELDKPSFQQRQPTSKIDDHQRLECVQDRAQHEGGLDEY